MKIHYVSTFSYFFLQNVFSKNKVFLLLLNL